MDFKNNSIKNLIQYILLKMHDIDKKTKNQIFIISHSYLSLHNYMNSKNYISSPYNSTNLTKCVFAILDSINNFNYIIRFCDNVKNTSFYKTDKTVKELTDNICSLINNKERNSRDI